jgi:hypothetical protein
VNEGLGEHGVDAGALRRRGHCRIVAADQECETDSGMAHLDGAEQVYPAGVGKLGLAHHEVDAVAVVQRLQKIATGRVGGYVMAAQRDERSQAVANGGVPIDDAYVLLGLRSGNGGELRMPSRIQARTLGNPE